MEKIFIRFTIKGDDLDLHEISESISVQADLYVKGNDVPRKFESQKPMIQKTNRWVYSIESKNNENLNRILKRLIKNLNPWLNEINRYTKKYQSLLDIVIYTNTEEPLSRYNIKLSKTSLKNICKLNTPFSLTVFDW